MPEIQFPWPRQVRRYPYRTAEVQNRFLTIAYEEHDDVYDFHKVLVERCGRTVPDNHECFRLLLDDGITLVYLQFSDCKLYIGKDILLKEANP